MSNGYIKYSDGICTGYSFYNSFYLKSGNYYIPICNDSIYDYRIIDHRYSEKHSFWYKLKNKYIHYG